MSSALTATNQKLYDRSFILAFFSQVLFVPANAALVHYAEWVQYLYQGDEQGALLELGYITSFGAILGFISRPWLGQLGNRLGARTIWIAGYLLFIGGFMGNLLLEDVNWLIYALRGIMFLGVACIFLSSITYITLTTPEERRTEATRADDRGYGARAAARCTRIRTLLLDGSDLCHRLDVAVVFYAVAARQRQGRITFTNSIRENL